VKKSVTRGQQVLAGGWGVRNGAALSFYLQFCACVVTVFLNEKFACQAVRQPWLLLLPRAFTRYVIPRTRTSGALPPQSYTLSKCLYFYLCISLHKILFEWINTLSLTNVRVYDKKYISLTATSTRSTFHLELQVQEVHFTYCYKYKTPVSKPHTIAFIIRVDVKRITLAVNDQLQVLADLSARKEIWVTNGQIRIGATVRTSSSQ
jgi:hypothetical protein